MRPIGIALSLALTWAIGVTSETRAQDPPSERTELPRVVLIGDSIRLGYAPQVAEQLKGVAQVISPEGNGGDSRNVLAHLDEWVIRQKPDVIHWNCGLHDLKKRKADGQYQVDLAQYGANLNAILDRLRRETQAAIVFANTTPILDARHAKRGADFDRFESDVLRYNVVAEKVFRGQGVPVHDLHGIVEQGGSETWLRADGTHYTPTANDRLAEAVADCVRRQLTIARYKPLPRPASGPKAVEAYKAAEVERDRQVPPIFRRQSVGEFAVPRDADDWKARRPSVLEIVSTSLGDLPPRPDPSRARVVTRELRNGYRLESVSIENGVDGAISALLLVPEGIAGPVPAILWLHSSTPDKTQILIPDTNGGAEPLGETFVRAGYAVLSPDAYWHGDRVGTGPSGTPEIGRNEQESLFKWHLWHGRTLWGMFVRDDRIALDYLCTRPEIDVKRIGATGMSMGSTRAWWLAAVDERIAAVVAVACFTRYQNLIAHGDLRQHGIYYFVNGLLKHFDTEGVLALIAPRPLLAITGDLDAGSPADGVKALELSVGRTYAALGATDRFRSDLDAGIGHTFTPEMRTRMLEWFERWLKPKMERTVTISEPAEPALDKADRIILYSIEPDDDEPKAKDDKKSFHGYPILGSVELKEAKDRSAIVKAFRDAIENSDGIARCFSPRHALRVIHGRETSDYVICFECTQYSRYQGSDRKRGIPINESAGPIFNRVLKAAGIPLAPSD